MPKVIRWWWTGKARPNMISVQYGNGAPSEPEFAGSHSSEYAAELEDGTTRKGWCTCCPETIGDSACNAKNFSEKKSVENPIVALECSPQFDA